MCGIIGAFADDINAQQRVRDNLHRLWHRGPDYQNVVNAPGFTFGHTLLSIIGLTPITQPIASSDGRFTVTFNGEIYNYVELMDDDLRVEQRCTERSDTQVLVEGLSLYGIDFVNQLNGIFAFAAFDHQTQVGYLVRDRLGVKPAYYTQNHGVLYFASEMKPLLEMSGASADLYPEAFYSYARFRYPIGHRTYYRSLKAVPPGHILTVKDGQIASDVYWDIGVPPPFAGTYEEARDQTETLFLDAVSIQMRSDHSFCTYLSGGLDSSYLTAIARQTKPELDTYSIGLRAAGFDESKYAQAVANTLNTRHHPYLLDEAEYREQHATMVEHLASPISVPNQVALKILSRELSRDHRCVLSGEGADEVFGGYGRIFLLPADWSRMQAQGTDTDTGRQEVLRRIRNQYGSTEFADYPAFFLRRYGYLTHEEAVELMSAYLPRPELDAAREVVEGEIRDLFNEWDTDLYTRQLLLFQKIHLPGLLMRVDTSTMAHHVEGRVPFLDHRVVELLNSFPIHYKMRRLDTFDRAAREGLTSDELSEEHDVPKAILKEIAERVVPRHIVRRKKVGFPMPADFYRCDGGEGSSQPSYIQWVDRNMRLLTETEELV